MIIHRTLALLGLALATACAGHDDFTHQRSNFFFVINTISIGKRQSRKSHVKFGGQNRPLPSDRGFVKALRRTGLLIPAGARRRE